MSELKGTNYKERVEEQLNEWVKGNPIHNQVEDECCPDFSCCKPHLLADEQTRKLFKAANEDQREGMLFGFLGEAIARELPGIKVYLVNGKTEIDTINN